jgi:hypothetical protein
MKNPRRSGSPAGKYSIAWVAEWMQEKTDRGQAAIIMPGYELRCRPACFAVLVLLLLDREGVASIFSL